MHNKTNKIALILLFAILLLGLFTHCSWATVHRITSLGDSITASQEGYSSYRYYLWHLINEHTVDFVGTQAGVMLGEPLYPDFDQAHEGHPGWFADMVLDYIDQWVQQTNPDIVLCHLGTNDLWRGESVSSTIDEISQIIDRIRVVNPNVAILLAQIIPCDEILSSTIEDFNSEIAILAAQKNTQDSPVVTVDQWTGFQTSTDTFDGVHPNDQGEQKMAEKFHAKLLEVLPDPSQISTVWADSRVTLNMRSEDDDAIGIMFRVLDNHNYYRFSWDSERSYRRLVKVVNGQTTLLGEDAVPYVPGQTYQVKIIADGTTLEVWIDGSQIFSVVDSDIVEGTFAFYNWANSESYFDDVLVENISTGITLLSENFIEGEMTDLSIVDEASEQSLSNWSAESGMLVQSSDIYSLPLDPAELPKLGTYALYNISAQQDSDGDGIGDVWDGCPLDINKVSPGDCGCGTADTDTDSDGISDCNDNCPNVSNPSQEDIDKDGIGNDCEEPLDQPCAISKAKAAVKLCKSYLRVFAKQADPNYATEKANADKDKAEYTFSARWDKAELVAGKNDAYCDTGDSAVLSDIIKSELDDIKNVILEELEVEINNGNEAAVKLGKALLKTARKYSVRMLNAELNNIKKPDIGKFENALLKANIKFDIKWYKAVENAGENGIAIVNPQPENIKNMIDYLVDDILAFMNL